MTSPINSVKHFVPRTITALASGSVSGQTIINTIAKGGTRDTVDDVEEGAVIKAIHVELWINGQGTSGTGTGAFTLILVKIPAGGTAPDATDMLNLQSYENKRNILYTTQGVIAGQGAQSIPLYRNWLIIPKGKQRFALGDIFQVVLLATGAELDLCGLSMYKEYY